MSASPYPLLFSPYRLRDLTIPNRVAMAPMSTGMAGPNGELTEDQIAFYGERARGGTGMIIVEFTCVDRASGVAEDRQLSLDNPANIDGHKRLVDVIKAAGSVPCIQLQHGGPFAKRHLVEGGMPWAPSDFYFGKRRDTPYARGMTAGEVEFLVEQFGRTAELAVQAGYEALELHGAHGYLLASFLSPLTNQRDDEWGGDETRRMKFATSVLKRIRAVIGNRPLIYRMSVDEFAPGGLTIDDSCRIAPHLVAAGADALHASTGLGWVAFEKVVEPMSTPEGWRLPYARKLREAAKCPVIGVGQIRWPETAEKALAEGDCDLIALGRPLLADPAWANKAKAGALKDITPCTSCNFCIQWGMTHGGVACAENPRTAHERDAIPDAGPERGKPAVVVGAGPGGLSAALLLDKAGYQTELYETRDVLGGGLIASAAPPHKEKLEWYRQHLVHRLSGSGVKLHLNEAAKADEVIARRPAITIVAAGAQPKQMPIEGIDHPLVFDAYESLMGDDRWLPANRELPVLIYGGGETGTETAEYAAERGYKVLLVSRSPASKLARSAESVYRKVLLDRVAKNPLIEVIENTAVTRIGDDGATLQTNEGAVRTVPVSRVLIAQGRDPDNGFAERLSAAGLSCVTIGDNRKGGRIGDAVHDAYHAVKDHVDALAPARA